MAVLYIAECKLEILNGVPVAKMPPLREQTVAIGGSSTPSNPFGPSTDLVRLETDAICSVAWGLSPTATTSNMRLAINHCEYFAVNPGDSLAVITNT